MGVIDPKARAVRDRILLNTGFLDDTVVAGVNKSSMSPLVAKDSAQRPNAFLRAVGNDLYNNVVRILQKPLPPQRACATNLFVKHLFSKKARMCATRRVESALVSLTPDTFKRRVIQAAALCHITSRLFIAGLVSALLNACSLGQIHVHAVLRCVTFDETPLPMRASMTTSKRMNPDAMHSELPVDCQDVLANESFKTVREKGTMKIVQTHVCLAFVFQELSTRTWRYWRCPLACPLAVVDKATGPALAETLQEHLLLPGLEHVMAQADVVQDLSVADRAPANLAAEEIAYAANGDALRLKADCSAHGVSNAQGYSFCAVSATISGIISASLLQRAGGAVQLLRSCIEEVLHNSLVLRGGCHPPPAHDSRVLYRNSVFDLCLGQDLLSQRRRANLELLLNGNLQSHEIHMHIADPNLVLDKRLWAKTVASLLLPRAIDLFPRTLQKKTFNKPESQVYLKRKCHPSFPTWLVATSVLKTKDDVQPPS